MLIALATCLIGAATGTAEPSSTLPQLLSQPLSAVVHAASSIDDLDDAIAEGREGLVIGDLRKARRAFERAEGMDAKRAEFWMLRLQSAEGGHDDVLGALSKRRRNGERGDHMTYLSGWALLNKARAEILGGGSGNVAFLLEDAANQLGQVAESEDQRLSDACIGQAMALRLNGASKQALAAGRQARSAFPQSVDACDVVGRAALSLAAGLSGDEAQVEQFKTLLGEAQEAFEAGLAAIGETRDAQRSSTAGQLAGQLATVHLYAEDQAAAKQAYGLAIGWDPASAEFGTAFNVLERGAFIEACESGAKAFLKRFGKRDQRDATTQWWLGYALFTTNDLDRMEDAVTAFESTLEKWPGYTNSWYYLFRLNYDLKEIKKAVNSLREMRTVAPDQLASLIQADSYDVSRLEGLVGQSFNAGRLEDSAEICRVLVLAQPDNDRFWNNLGLFLRDAGDLRARRAKDEDEEEWAAIAELWEESWVAYSKAVELAPGSAPYLNDAAVLLHYNLQRDYDQALDMYAKATELAEARMEEGDFASAEEKDVWRLALRDSKNNRRALMKQLGREEEEEEEEKALSAQAG